MTALAAAEPAGPSVAVIGAGVAGCAVVAELCRLDWSGPIALWESGRGPGGRASTRRSRRDDGWQLDHGAPIFNITGRPPPGLLEPLLQLGAIEPWRGQICALDGEGRLQPSHRDPFSEGHLYRGRGGMDRLCRGLLDLADEAAGGKVLQNYGTLVRDLAVSAQGRWQLLGTDGQGLGEADWLVLSGTLLAHPRSRALLGLEKVPLRQAAWALEDPVLERVLTAIASIGSQARSNLLLVLPEELAGPWQRMPFRLLVFDAEAQRRWGLSRLSVQPLEDGRCAVVAHSSAAFAEEHGGVMGSRSSMARLLGKPPVQEQEEAVIEALSQALLQALQPRFAADLPAGAEALSGADRSLMRWGAAFPLAPGLPADWVLCADSRVGFCGDYLAGEGFARVEGALRSGERLAALMVAAQQGS